MTGAGALSNQPIIVVGTGRCGSTMLHRLLALHEQVGWLSTLNEIVPGMPWVSLFSNLYRRRGFPTRVKEARVFPKPYEAYRFWEHYLPGFSRRDRPLTAADVPTAGIAAARRATDAVVRWQRRERLLVKITGWSRIAYFDRVYPGARFVSLRRDPRSVVSSWLKAGWLDVTSPPDSPDWQWGKIPDGYLQAWSALGGDPVLTAALKIRLDLEDIATNMELFPDRCHELWYEELISRPRETLRELVSFAGLEWTPGFDTVVGEMEFFDSSAKWKGHLGEDKGELILKFLRRTDALNGLDSGVHAAATGP